MPKEHDHHLSAEEIQALLEGDLPELEATTLQGHVSSCARCRTEVEAFELLFAELGNLSELVPSEQFAARVMAELPDRLSLHLVDEPEHAPLGERVRGWWGRRGSASASVPGHPGEESLQDYAEGMLPARQRTRIETHLAACTRCEKDVVAWSTLFSELSALPELAPSEGFGERVMARVRVPAPKVAKASAPTIHLPTLLEEWGGKLRPRTRRGWVVAGGMAVAPAVGLIAVTVTILAHPLLSFGLLASYAGLQVNAAFSALGTWLMGHLLESAITFQIYSFLSALVASPALAGAGAVTLAALMAASIWIFYRNLILPTMAANHHAR